MNPWKESIKESLISRNKLQTHQFKTIIEVCNFQSDNNLHSETTHLGYESLVKHSQIKILRSSFQSNINCEEIESKIASIKNSLGIEYEQKSENIKKILELKEEIEPLQQEFNQICKVILSDQRKHEELSHHRQDLSDFIKTLLISQEILKNEQENLNKKIDKLIEDNNKLSKESNNIISQMLKMKEESMTREDEIFSMMQQMKQRSKSIDVSIDDYEIVDDDPCYEKYSRSFNVKSPHRNLADFKAHEVEGILVAYNKSGSVLFSSGSEKKLKVWDHLNGIERKSFSGYSQTILAMSVSDSNDLILGGCSSGAGYLWNFNNAKLKHKLNGHGAKINGTGFTKFGSVAVTGAEDLTLRFWDVTRGYSMKSINLSSLLYSLSASSLDSSILTGHKDGTLGLWLQNSNKCTKLVTESSAVTSCEFSPCGNYIAGQMRNNRLVVFDMRMMEVLARLSHKDLKCPSVKSGISFSPMSKFLSCGSFNGKIITWDFLRNDVTVLPASDKPVVSVQWNPNESQLAAIDISGGISIWE